MGDRSRLLALASTILHDGEQAKLNPAAQPFVPSETKTTSVDSTAHGAPLLSADFSPISWRDAPLQRCAADELSLILTGEVPRAPAMHGVPLQRSAASELALILGDDCRL